MDLQDHLLTQEEKMIRDTVRQIAKDRIAPLAVELDEEESFPWEQLEALKKAGLMGILVPEEFGGINASKLSYVCAVEEIARVCAATSLVYFTQTHGLLSVALFGSPQQKEKYLPPAASGERLTALAVTEPNAGSDVASMETTATRVSGGYVLNGTKIFITTGDKADYLTVFAKTNADAGHRGISAFIVEKGFEGFNVGKVEKKMGVRGSSTAELWFNDCFVPEENRIGEEGEGFKICMTVFDYTRLSTAAQALGIAQGAFDIALEYALQRRQFKQPIFDFQGIQFMISEMYTEISAARSLLYQTARLVDEGKKSFATEAAMVKLYCSEVAGRVTNHAVQILGGHGYIRENRVERMMRDAKITQIYDGTNQIQKVIIAKNLRKKHSKTG